jgi:hypothetical protein
MHIGWKNVKEGDNLEDQRVDDRRIILKSILRKYGAKVWTGCTRLRIGTVTGFYQQDNQHSSSTKNYDFLD